MHIRQDIPLIAPETLTQGHNMIAITSGKGGVGKTWLSITLAHALAKRGHKTLLFDGDLGLANIGVQLGLNSDQNISHILEGTHTLNQAIISYAEGGFDFIAGYSGSFGITNTAASRLNRLSSDLAVMSASYDRVLIDLGTGVEQSIRQLSRHAQDLIVVITAEASSVADAYAFLQATFLERPQINLHIIVNNVDTAREGERTYNLLLKACEEFLKTSPSLLGVIRRDPKVVEAIGHQVPLLLHSPNCDAAVDVENIAARLFH